MMNVNDKVDDLLGRDMDGNEVRLSQFPGKKSPSISIRKIPPRAARPRPATCATICPGSKPPAIR